MKLPLNLTKKFSKALAPAKETNTQPKSLLGTVVKHGDNTFVILDGSTIETPVELAVDAEDGDRVAVQIKDHKATVVNNYTAPPSARTATNFMQLTEEGLVISLGEDSSDMQVVITPTEIYFKYYDGTQWRRMMTLAPRGLVRPRDYTGYDDVTDPDPGVPSPIDPNTGFENVDYTVRAIRMDNIMQLRLGLRTNTSVLSGRSIFEGQIVGNGFTPDQYTTGVGYYGARAIVGRISPNGSVIVRNTTSESLVFDDEVILSFTYILNEDDI